jgi:protein-tyrosine phosphatase
MTTSVELRLQGAPNFRDIGGHPTTDGRRIKRERIFRSGELSHLTDADLAHLRKLNFSCVADLRSLGEGEVHRSRWPEGMDTKLHRANISMDMKLNGRPLTDVLKDDPTPTGAGRVMSESFRLIPDMCGPALKQISDQLAHDNRPVLFHCTNGRDRTGVISALLLYMLDANRESIVQDFITTNERINVEQVIENSIVTFRQALGIEVSRATMELCTLVSPGYIDVIFQFLEEKYGAVNGFLHTFGIDDALIQKLRQRLLEPA